MKKLTRIINESYWSIFAIGNFNALLNLLMPLILVRILTPEQIGKYKIFFLYVSLIPFFTMTAGYLTSFYYWVGDKNSVKLACNAIYRHTFFLSIIAFIPTFTVCYFLLKEQTFSVYQIFQLSLIGLIAAPSALYGEYLMASGKTLKSMILSTSFEIIKVIGFIYIAYSFKDVNFLFSYYMLMMIGSFLIMNLLSFRQNIFNLRSIDSNISKRVSEYSMPISISAALVIIIEKADQLILATFLSTHDYSFYILGCLTVPTILILESSIQKKLIPKLSELYQENKINEMKTTFIKAIEDISFLTIPSIFGLIIYSDIAIEILYTNKFNDAKIYLQIFSFSYLMYLIPHDSFLRATGNSKLLLKLNIIFAIFSIIVILFVAIYFNAITTMIVGIIIKIVYRYFALNKSCTLIGIKTLDLFKSKILATQIILSMLLSVLCIYLNNLYDNKIFGFIVNASIFAIIYLGYFFIKKRVKI